MSGGGAGNKPGTDEELAGTRKKAAILDPQEEGGFLES